MLAGKTKSGFEYEIDERAKNDWRFVKLIPLLKSGSDDEQAQALFDVVSMLFKDNGVALEAHIAAQNDGFVPSDIFIDEVIEILTSDDDLKKS